MAVPFNTRNEDTEEYYRLLAQLLQDVIAVVNLLIRRPPPPPPRYRSAHVVTPDEVRTAQLPDLVQCSMTSLERLRGLERLQDPQCPVPRPRPNVVPPRPAPRRTNVVRRRHVRNPSSTSENSWAQVGEDLKMIADAFTGTMREAQSSAEGREEEVDEEKKQQESLLSLLMPSSSFWTAVIFIVGWRLLTRRGR